MKVPELLNAMMQAAGVKQSGLAEMLGVDQPQISRWRRGQDPQGENRDRILTLARKMRVIDDFRSEDVADSLAPPRPDVRMVKVKGYVGASAEAVYYRVSDEYLEEVPAPEGASDQTVAVEVRGDSLGEAFDSWSIFYDDVRSPITEDLIGHLCVVGLADDRLLVKRLLRHDGEFILRSNSGGDDIVGAEIEWAAKVTSMRPR